MHPLCVGLGRWASRYHTKGREAPGLLTQTSPLWGTSLGWWGKGRHTVTRGAPVKTHCSWGEPWGPHSPGREIRHVPWDCSPEKALSTGYRGNQNQNSPRPTTRLTSDR